MNKSLHSLNALRAFEATARLGTLSKASDELNVTHGAVSRLIAQLEGRLNVKLFERRHRQLILTHEGEVLLKGCSYAFDVLRHTLHEVKKSHTKALTVSCEPTIAMRWLIPRLSDFQNRYPEYPVHIFAAGGAIHFKESQIDLAIRRNDFQIEPTYHHEFLADEWIAPVVHPELLSNKNTPAVCQLHTKTRPNAWQKWQDSAEKNSSLFHWNQELWFEHFYLTLQAAASKLGVAIASIYMVGDDLRNQSLSAPFPFIKDDTHYVLIAPKPIDSDEGKQAFRDWLIEQFVLYQQEMNPLLSH